MTEFRITISGSPVMFIKHKANLQFAHGTKINGFNWCEKSESFSRRMRYKLSRMILTYIITRLRVYFNSSSLIYRALEKHFDIKLKFLRFKKVTILKKKLASSTRHSLRYTCHLDRSSKNTKLPYKLLREVSIKRVKRNVLFLYLYSGFTS